MKISISGHGKAGKDSLAIWMKEHTVLNYTKSTSAYCKKEMFEWFKERGIIYKDEEECYNDRHNHREEWAAYIDVLNKDDPAFLYKRCLAEQDILTGVRRRHEFEAVKSLNVIDLSIWVHRPDNPLDPTQGYGPELCDLVLYNDSLDALFKRARKVFGMMGLLKERTVPNIRILQQRDPKDCLHAVTNAQGCSLCGTPLDQLPELGDGY